MPIFSGDAVHQLLEGVFPPRSDKDKLAVPDSDVDRRTIGKPQLLDEGFWQPNR